MKRRPHGLAAFARKVSRRAHNRPGTDKTFVHHAVHQYFLHKKVVRPA